MGRLCDLPDDKKFELIRRLLRSLPASAGTIDASTALSKVKNNKEGRMVNAVRHGFRIGIRPDPKNGKRYLWTLNGTQMLFREESSSSYDSVEQAIADAQARADELAR